MQLNPVMLDQAYVWEILPARFGAEIDSKTVPLWDRVGIFDEYGPFGPYFSGEDEGEEFNSELTGILLCAVEAIRLQRMAQARDGRGVGRPSNPMIVPLGRDLVALYFRYHTSGGRHSVMMTVDGKSVQKEAGPLLAFVTEAIEPLNRFLVEELHLRPLSPARVLRVGLRARRYPRETVAPQHF